MTDLRPWPTDTRYMASPDGYVVGPSGRRVGSLDRRSNYYIVSHRPPGGTRTSTTVHSIVCETFNGPRPPGMQACHNNGDVADCRATNLRWDIPQGNAADRVAHRTNGRKLTNEDVQAIRAASGVLRAALAAQYGVSVGMVSHIRNGYAWSNLPGGVPRRR